MAQQQSLQTQQQGLQSTTRQAQGTLTRLPEKGGMSTDDISQANQWLDEAAQIGHVVAPAMYIPVQPEGYGVAVTRLQVKDLSTQGNDLYPIKGGNKLGLHKGFLDDVGRAYGCDWPPAWTFPEPYPEGDPRNSDPYCIKITVAGRYKDYDGSWKTMPALTKEIDLRDGSSDVLMIFQQQEDKALYGLSSNATSDQVARAKAEGRKKAEAELAHARKFLRAYAQTKARLQVIGTLVRRSYTMDELKKPFFIFKTIFTGRSDNPEVAKIYAQRIADREFGATEMLYGPSAPKQLPSVSNESYPEPDDAGVVSDVTREPQERSEQFCTAEHCFGDESDGHIRACREPKTRVTEQTPKQAEDWTIPLAFPDVAGTKLADLSDSKLSTMVGACDLVCENKEWADKHAEYRGYHGHLHTEALRREALKKQTDQY